MSRLRSGFRATVIATGGIGIAAALVPTAEPMVAIARVSPARPALAPPTSTATPTPTPTPTSTSTSGPCPDGMVHVEKFCIDRYEAHVVVGEKGGPLALWPHNQPVPKHQRYEARSEAGFFPQGYINQLEAARACDNAGKRLCRLDEWRRACVGAHGDTYGYGKVEQPGRCNKSKSNLLDQLWGHDARKWGYDEQMNNPLLDAIAGYLARSGEYEGCTSAEGVNDMVGNLHEWVGERVSAALSRRFQGEAITRMPQPYRLGNGILLGGFFSTGKQHGPGCYYTTLAHMPSYHDYSTGFRCCADPK